MFSLSRGFVGLVLAWGITVTYWLVVSIPVAILPRSVRLTISAPILRTWARLALAAAGSKIHVHQEHHVAGRKARVVLLNHGSLLDAVLVSRIMSPAPLAMGKREIIYIPVVNLGWWSMDFVRIDRGNRERAIETLRQTTEGIVRDQRSIYIAPEGTRSRDGKMLPFKKGPFRMAIDSKAPLVPMVVYGAYQMWPRHRKIPRPCPIHISFLPPISVEDWTLENMETHIQAVREKMMTEYGRLEGLYGPNTSTSPEG